MIKKKIEKLVEQKKKETDIVYFDKYASLFHDAYRFLATKKALLYGGTALNELLPTALKIYDPYTLPDIDVLSPDAERLAKQMVHFYKKKKHQAVSFTEALHPGTYKVYADGVQIADITQCSQKTYDSLLSHCVRSKQWKIKIVPPQYIRMTLHKILSQPNDAHRWENVFERLKRYYKTFPITDAATTCKQQQNTNTPQSLVVEDELYKLLPPETVFFGKREVEQMMDTEIPLFYTPIHALTTHDLAATAKMLKQELPQLTFSRVFPPDDFVPQHMVFFYQGRPIATLYHLSSCVAFNTYKNKRVASINAVIDLLLSMSMSDYPHWKSNKKIFACLANKLSKIQQQNNSNSNKKLLKQIVMSCYGPTIGLITMRRERAKRLRRKKKNTENVY
jgi:hypothetical protein